MIDKQNVSFEMKPNYIIFTIIGLVISFISGLYGVINQIVISTDIGIILLCCFFLGIVFGFYGLAKIFGLDY